MREAKHILRSGTAERSETAEGRESPTDRSFTLCVVGTSTMSIVQSGANYGIICILWTHLP